MNNYVTGSTIKLLREKKGYTQRQLAEKLMVSDKAVSKWESGRGLPDISLIEPLAKTLGVSLAELFSGECVQNTNRHGNMHKSKFYVCPVCGNVIFAAGEGAFSCCGVQLPPLEAEQDEEEHRIATETIEGDLFVSMQHPMEKTHFISFFALVLSDRVQLVKLYPEQDASARFPVRGRGTLYAYCNRHGLFSKRL
jgi:DNA-binding XRE family transcriptional regulator/desulfoferrodoxin (superoxide reductase-like protein)